MGYSSSPSESLPSSRTRILIVPSAHEKRVFDTRRENKRELRARVGATENRRLLTENRRLLTENRRPRSSAVDHYGDDDDV